MAGEKGGQFSLVGEGSEAVERAEVVREVAVAGYDRGAAAQDRVAGEQGVVGREVQADRVGGVARGRHHMDLAAGCADHVSGGQALVAEAVGGVGGSHGGAGHRGEGGGALGVVGVGVGEQDPRDRLPGGADLIVDAPQVRLVIGAGVDHDGVGRAGLGDHPGIGAVQRHQRGVRGQHTTGAGRTHAVDRTARRGAVSHSGYSRPAGTLSHAAPSATWTSGMSAVIRRRAASAAVTSPHARSSPSVTAALAARRRIIALIPEVHVAEGAAWLTVPAGLEYPL